MEYHPAQVAAWLAAAATFFVTALKILKELRDGRKQRELELRWKQAEAGKSLNDEMQTDERAWPAMQMLDSDRREFVLSGDQKVVINQADIAAALDPETASSPKTDFIRDCFDTFFYFLAMFEHHISNGLVRQEDVAYPIEYYLPLLARHRNVVDKYLANFNLARTRKYLERFQAWGQPG